MRGLVNVAHLLRRSRGVSGYARGYAAAPRDARYEVSVPRIFPPPPPPSFLVNRGDRAIVRRAALHFASEFLIHRRVPGTGTRCCGIRWRISLHLGSPRCEIIFPRRDKLPRANDKFTGRGWERGERAILPGE